MNFNQLLKQAQQIQKKVNKTKKEFTEKVFDFEGQQGIVSGKVNGNLELLELHIKEEMISVENKEMLEDMLIVSINEIMKKIDKEREDTLNKITNGVNVSAFL